MGTSFEKLEMLSLSSLLLLLLLLSIVETERVGSCRKSGIMQIVFIFKIS